MDIIVLKRNLCPTKVVIHIIFEGGTLAAAGDTIFLYVRSNSLTDRHIEVQRQN